jgi:parvulin-like peptidyl-prolyl isomerase
MKRINIACFAGIALSLMLLAGCGKKLQGKFTDEQMQNIPLRNPYNLPPASGGMVLAVYSEALTADEILALAENTMKPAAAQVSREEFLLRAQPYFREMIRGKVTDILVYQEARKKAPENIDESLEKAVNSEVARFIAGYNNNYALAEKKIKEMGYDWRSFREYQKKLIMTQSYISSNLKDERRFSYQELVDYYNRIRDEQFCETGIIEFSLIEIIPGQMKPDQVAEGQTPEQAARRLAEDVLAKAQAGEDFAQLAKQFSHGPLAAIGGKMRPVTVGAGSLPKPYDVLEAVATEMQPGQVKGPVENDGRLFIVSLANYQPGGCKSFDEVQKQIEYQMQFEYRQEQYSEFVNRLVRKANVVSMDQFAEFCTRLAWDRWGKGSAQASNN